MLGWGSYGLQTLTHNASKAARVVEVPQVFYGGGYHKYASGGKGQMLHVSHGPPISMNFHDVHGDDTFS